jgi:hypothetical protein
MYIKAVDVVILLAAGVDSLGGDVRPERVACMLDIDIASVHRSLHTCERSGLYSVQRKRVIGVHLLEYMTQGIQLRNSFPSEIGDITAYTMGDVTRDAPGVLGGPGYVWEVDGGMHRGLAIKPLHKCVPAAARQHKAFGEVMRMVDSLRCGRARERAAASVRIHEILAMLCRI